MVDTPETDDAKVISPEGHGKPCYFCHKSCNSFSGNPSLWPVAFSHSDGFGDIKWHHAGCIAQLIKRHDALAVERDALIEVLEEIGAECEGYQLDLKHQIDIVVNIVRQALALNPASAVSEQPSVRPESDKIHDHTEASSVRLSVRHANGKCEQEVCNGCVVYCVSMEDAARRVPDMLKDAVEITLTAPSNGSRPRNDKTHAGWLADKIHALGDYAKEAASMLNRWPEPPPANTIAEVQKKNEGLVTYIQNTLPNVADLLIKDGEQRDLIRRLADELQDALNHATIEKHLPRPWHERARDLIAEATGGSNGQD